MNLLTMKTNKIYNLYLELYSMYWPQWWWPIINYNWKNSTKKWNDKWYHLLDYSFPRDENELFEICLWSILTQNTNFQQVVKSLNNLNQANALNYFSIENMDISTFKDLIKPSWFFNQKSSYVLNFIKYFKSLNWSIPIRKDLLKVKWIWQETADSILLYAYNRPEFVVDAYTKRFFIHLWLIDETVNYVKIKNIVEDEFKKIEKKEEKLVIIYQEFHALIVNHAKQFYSKKPYWVNCLIVNKL